jgi:hypothetical protein
MQKLHTSTALQITSWTCFGSVASGPLGWIEALPGRPSSSPFANASPKPGAPKKPNRVSATSTHSVGPQSPEPSPEESAPPSEPALEEPALQLQLDDSGVVPPPQRTPDGYTLEEMELRAKRAKIGLGVSAASLVVGGVLVGVAIPNLTGAEGLSGGSGNCPMPGWSVPVFVTGVASLV